ncbi:MAG: ComEC/Rec2 family competence protein [Bacteroidetes bacterium]|nr:ComEC/Rec2 family competence protein [Bacteroidota bacterium]MBS1628635.1 ComEC/Rec2 family competence protein [Bacteroidota bacterium]
MPSWSPNENYFWRQAPLFRPLLFLMLGIFACDYNWLGTQPLPGLLILLIFSGILLCVLAFYRGYSSWLQALFFPLAALFFFCAGASLYATSSAFKTPFSSAQTTSSESASLVRVVSKPQPRPRSTRLQVERWAELKEGQLSPAQGEALLYVYNKVSAPDFATGDSLMLPNNWQPIHNQGNPFEMDFARFQKRRGIRMQQFLSPEQIQIIGRQSDAQQGWLQGAHQRFERQLRTYIRDPQAFGLLQAMLLGDESNFDTDLRQAYAQTGVIHIVSISGSHVAALYLIVLALFFWARGQRGLWLKVVSGILLVWLYVLIAGAPPSALRSALMFTVLSLGLLGSRETNPLNTLAAAALALLAFQPAWMFSVGFQLSFAAVLSMMLLYAPILRLWAWPHAYRLTRMLWQTLAASLSAEILTAPLVIYYFHNFPLLFLPANILAMVLVGFCALAGGLMVIALAWWPWAAGWVGKMVSALIHLFNDGIIWMQSLNFEALQHLRISSFDLLLLYLLLAAIAAWWLRNWQRGLISSLALSCALMASLCWQQFSTQQQEKIVVFSAGKKASVEWIEGNKHHALSPTLDTYATTNANIGFGAWRKGDEENRNCFVLRGKKVLYLRDSSLKPGLPPFPIDVLIIENPVWALKAESLTQVFSPSTVVLAGRPGPKTRAHWLHHCREHKIALHDAATQGAWVLE